MGNNQELVIPQSLLLLSSTGTIIGVSLIVCLAWLFYKFKKHNSEGAPLIDLAINHKGDFFKLFSRVSIFIICTTLVSAKIFYDDDLMDAVFDRIPNFYVFYILAFAAYDTFWEILGQFGYVGRS